MKLVGDSPEATNPVVRAILERRSVRSGFSAKAVPDRILAWIARCGLAAPSSKNAQPWRLHVVSDRGLLDDLARAVTEAPESGTYVPHDPTTGRPHARWQSTVRESADVLRNVPAAIFVENRGTFSRGRRALLASDRPALEASIVGYTLEVLGVGTALQNLWLALHSLGLVGVFMGDVLIAEETLADRLGVETDLVGVLAFGYPAQPSEPTTEPTLGDDEDPRDLGPAVRWHGAELRQR